MSFHMLFNRVRGNIGQNANVCHLTNTRLWFAQPSSFIPDIQFLWHSQMLRYLPQNSEAHGECLAAQLRMLNVGNGWMATLHYSCNVKEANKLITLSAKHAMKCLKWLNSPWTFADCCVICIRIVSDCLNLKLHPVGYFKILYSLVTGHFKYAHKLHSGCVCAGFWPSCPLATNLVKCQLPATPVNCG